MQGSVFPCAYIYGAGGHGRVVKDLLLELGWKSWTFVDDAHPSGVPVVSSSQIPQGSLVFMGIGDNKNRERLVQRLRNLREDLIFSHVQHPNSYQAFTAHVQEGAVLCVNSVVHTEANIGRFAIINTAATVDHDCKIGDYAHIAPGVNLCGTVTVGDRTLVGVGSSVRPDINIGSDTIIGAGSVVVNDIPSGVVAHGNPCRVIKEIR